MKYLFVGILLTVIQTCVGQKIDWASCKEWKIYKLRGHGLFKYPVDTLHHIKSYPLNHDSVVKYVGGASILPKSSTPMWMGEYVASCQKDEETLKLEISYYGGFFYCEKDRNVYQIPDLLKKEWQDYMAACYNSLYP